MTKKQQREICDLECPSHKGKSCIFQPHGCRDFWIRAYNREHWNLAHSDDLVDDLINQLNADITARAPARTVQGVVGSLDSEA